MTSKDDLELPNRLTFPVTAPGIAAGGIIPVSPAGKSPVNSSGAVLLSPVSNELVSGLVPLPLGGVSSPKSPCHDDRIEDTEHVGCCGAMREPFLMRGYRIHCRRSIIRSLLSCFQLHNQTVNIWSHLLGTLFWARVAYRTPTSKFAQEMRGLPVASRLLWHALASMCTMGMSTIAHTFEAYSPRASQVLFSFDRAMIAILLMLCCHMSSAIHFRSSSYRFRMLLGLFTTGIGGVAALAISNDKLFTEVTKITVFGIQLALSALPALSECWKYRAYPAFCSQLLYDAGMTVGLAGAGGVIYASRVPERWWPRMFDYFGASHQIMHFLVLASTMQAYFGCRRWARGQLAIRREQAAAIGAGAAALVRSL